MKTFDKVGNITAAARKSRFPKFIAYIDGSGVSESGVYTKAMIETDLLEAMKTLENAVNQKVKDVYLCGIYQKTDETNDIGEPLYEMVIGARMGEERLNNWHFWDREHYETPHCLSCWYSKDFARDDVEEWNRLGSLQSA